MRKMLLALLFFGLIATAVELLLLGHDEDLLQFIPLILIAAAFVVLIWYAASGTRSSARVLRVLMAAFIIAGALGVGLHYRGSMEFQKEVDPSIQGFALFKKAVQSKTPPALAPGLMLQMGVVGLISTYKQKREI